MWNLGETLQAPNFQAPKVNFLSLLFNIPKRKSEIGTHLRKLPKTKQTNVRQSETDFSHYKHQCHKIKSYFSDCYILKMWTTDPRLAADKGTTGATPVRDPAIVTRFPLWFCFHWSISIPFIDFVMMLFTYRGVYVCASDGIGYFLFGGKVMQHQRNILGAGIKSALFSGDWTYFVRELEFWELG